jgi:2-polyprenyl-6-methoxyphenol hydroxylase-like FAD-dependent oxidoreductase
VQTHDVAIVGAGIAGSSTALALASAGLDVLVVERQVEYHDQVRGEIIWPWGVRAVRALGVENLLTDAGGQLVDTFDLYDEGAPEPLRLDVGKAVPGIPGSLNVRHPEACRALARAAAAAGAVLRAGVRDVHTTPGKQPRLSWTDADGRHEEAKCRLLVGADGRRSSVRAQAGIGLEVDPPAHLVAGMLVEAVPGLDRAVNVMARERDLIFYSFPQQDGKARLYFSFPNGQSGRFAGADRQARFLATSELDCLAGIADWERARPAGPCGTFPGEDTRAELPAVDGLALIGDAAGYENPLQGQGLSMAFQDALELSACVLAGDAAIDLAEYAERRSIRKRFADLGTTVEVWTNQGCIEQDPEERAARIRHVEADELLVKLELTFMTGFDDLPADVTQADVAERLATYRSSSDLR